MSKVSNVSRFWTPPRAFHRHARAAIIGGMPPHLRCVAALLLVLGCTDPATETGPDQSVDAADTGEVDAVDAVAEAPIDAGRPDAGPADAGDPDAAQRDARVRDARPRPDAAPGLPAQERLIDARFATSPTCLRCHMSAGEAQGLLDEAGRAIGQGDLWRATMMANAARDPYWRASVSAEVARAPEHAEEIEAECLRCHSPMAVYDQPQRISVLDTPTPEGLLGLDGVSCNGCHQITAEGLGEPASFSGGFVMNDGTTVFGPHTELSEADMVLWSGFRPVTGEHVRDSALCATCHTLRTGTGFLEQSPYLEWLASDYAPETGCQSCHMPSTSEDGVPLSTFVAITQDGTDYGDIPQRSMARHTFLGGNTLLLSILRDQADYLRPLAPPEAFDATIEATRRQLAQDTATLELAREGDELRVRITNRTGHKLPTAYPSRRMWLRVEARDAAGEVVLLSGDFDARGRVLVEGEVAPFELAGGPIEPHHQVVGAGEVQVYEAVMSEGGAPTFSVVSAEALLKDNRLPPRGWVVGAQPELDAIALGEDPDFGPTETVVYTLPAGAVTVEVRLLYQSVSPRWIAELFEFDTPEVATFRRFYEAADPRPEVLAEALLD